MFRIIDSIFIVSACFASNFLQIPVLKERLHEKERQLAELANNASNSNVMMTSSWHQAMSEAKRQYEAIDGALEVKSFAKDSEIDANLALSPRSLCFLDSTQYSEYRQRLPRAGKNAT